MKQTSRKGASQFISNKKYTAALEVIQDKDTGTKQKWPPRPC